MSECILHIYAPAPEAVKQVVVDCPFCLETTDVVVWMFYDRTEHTCLSCGFSSWRQEWKGMSPMSMAEVAENIRHARAALAITEGRESYESAIAIKEGRDDE